MNAIERLELLREQKQERMDEISKLVSEEGRTKSDAERDEYRGLSEDIKAIDGEIEDERTLESVKQRAVPVDGTSTEKAAGSRRTDVVVRSAPKPEPGIRFAQLAMCLAKAKGDPGIAHALMQRHYPQHPASPGLKMARERGEEYGRFIGKAAEWQTKAAVDGGTTADGSWTSALLAHNDFAGDFVEFLRARTLIGQFGVGSVPSMRRIPFNVHIKGQNAGGTGYWVGEGQPKPVTKFGYFDASHGFNKLAAISVLDDEIIRFSDPAAEALVRDGLGEAVIATLDTSLVDTVAVSTSRPAGLLNGVAGTVSSGNDHVAIKEDIKTLWGPAVAAELDPASAVYLTTPAIALSLSLMHGTLSDAPLFPGIGLSGGSLLGIPTLVSNYVPAGNVILVFASEVYLSDDGMVSVDASREATIEMETTPENAISDLDGSTPAPQTIANGAAFVSMFQTNSVALRAERYVNWSKRRATAVNRLTGVAWGDEAQS